MIGNKSDLLKERQVPQEKGQKFAEENGMFFMEVSAKDNVDQCVDKAIDSLISQVFNNFDEEMIEARKNDAQLVK